MHDAHAFLQALALVLGIAAVMTVVFQRLGQPVVLGYILAGLVIGPHVPIPLVADTAIVHTLSEIGVILLMFALGLEFSLRKLLSVGPVAGITALVQCSFMLWLGFVTGRAFGWTTMESAFLGALIAVSSTTIIAKVFDEQKVQGPMRDLVVGVLIVEDLIAILMMAVLTGIASGSGLTAGALALTLGRLAAFLVGLVGIGLLVVPRAIRYVVRLGKPETLLVASVGLCFAVSLLAQSFGYSVALGAFLAGSLVAESGEEKTIEHLVAPVKDVFAAIFFVSVGMLINPALVVEHWLSIVVVTVVVIVGKLIGVAIGAFLTGAGTRTSVQAGMSLAQIGEFSFIIASLGLTLKATGEFLYPIAVTVSAITTLTTPALIRVGDPFARWVDARLPKPLQTFVTLYGSWIEGLKQPRPESVGRTIRRRVRLMVLDAGAIAAIVIGAAVESGLVTGWLQETLKFSPEFAGWVLVAGTLTLVAPFVFGLVALARGLGLTLASLALPAREDGKLDLAAAPRRMLVVTLQIVALLAVGAPLVAITQPFLPGLHGAAILIIAVVVSSIIFWRRVTDLEGHVRAGIEVVMEALGKQTAEPKPHTDGHGHSKESEKDAGPLAQVRQLLPGLGEPVAFTLPESSPAVGQSLAQLGLRARTGASVLAICRPDSEPFVPDAQEVLRPGDLLALAGSHAAVENAKEALGAS